MPATTTITITVIYRFAPDDADTAAGILAQVASLSRLERGCLRYDPLRSNDDPQLFILFEQWSNQAALDAHSKSEHFVKLAVNELRPLAESRTVHRCTPIIA